ncbi:ribosomal RNA small subunit methyltransferase A [Candidatus Dojkabacteria bacterium]|nr:ribosomal RNA small subunit methyltransferase A [Candidatus Dojkabacteria bacterium]
MGFKFKKQFGQNFLKETSVGIKMIKSLDLKPDDTVIEVGPGHGAVTNLLIERTKRMILIEIDTELIDFLKDKYKEDREVEIIHNDILKINLKDLEIENNKYKVVGSLPYNISKKIIAKFLTDEIKPNIMSFLIQKEVAEDYASISPKASFLSNFAQIYSDVEFIGKVPKNHFFPIPKVDGGILQFKFKEVIPDYAEDLTKFIKIGYSSPRKKLISNLSCGLKISKEEIEKKFNNLHIKENIRAAELSLVEWQQIFVKLENVV